jgi:hypothetical protein
MAAEQVADFISAHRHVVREFDFENVFLTNAGTWEEALAPLSESSGSDEWSSQRSGSDVDSNSGLESLQSHIEFDQAIDDGEVPFDMQADVVRPPVVVTKLTKVHRRRRKRKHKDKAGQLNISSPLLGNHPVVDTLEPSLFDPSIQGVQPNAAQEAVRQELADDPDKMVMILKKAKEAVLRQLGKEFCRNHGKKDSQDILKHSCSSAWKSKRFIGHESNTALVPLMFSRY